MKSKFFGGLISLTLLVGTFMVGQAIVTTTVNATVTVGETQTISPAIQGKISVIISKLKSKRTHFTSSTTWNQYLERVLGQIDLIYPRYPQFTYILDYLHQQIAALKEVIINDPMFEFPSCGQPPMPVCPAGLSCTQVLPKPKTYTNYTDFITDKAQYLYNGICKNPYICPTYPTPAPGWCTGTIVGGGKDTNGCQLPPTCDTTTGGLQLDIKGTYNVGEKINILVKNTSTKDYTYTPTCGPDYDIKTSAGKLIQLENPLIAYMCRQFAQATIKAGEEISIGTWNQMEWKLVMTFAESTQNYMQSQVAEGTYKISAFGVSKDVTIGFSAPQCPALAPPICSAPGVVTSKKDANGCIINYACETTTQCPVLTSPAPGWCNGVILEAGKDANGCQLPPTCAQAR